MVNKVKLTLASIIYLLSLFLSIRIIQTTQNLFLIWSYGGIIMLSIIQIAESLEEENKL
jgi:hypothetical protein